MSDFNLDDIFTHIEVLKSREPEINVPKVIPCPFDNVKKEIMTASTPSALLECICTKMDATKPIFRDERQADGQFKVDVDALAYHGTGTASSKRAAKQEAARELLKKIIDAGEHDKHHIAGKTKEEAHNYVNGLAGVSSDDSGQQNSISELNIMCQKKKWICPEFTVNQEENGLFVCRAKFRGEMYVGEERTTKNDAKKSTFANILAVVKKDEPEKSVAEVNLLQPVPLANYLQRIVIDEPPTTEEDYEQGRFTEALQQLTEYRNPDGGLLFESIEYFDERTGTKAEQKQKEIDSELAAGKPVDLKNRPKELFTLVVSNLLLGTSTRPRRSDRGFFAMTERKESARGEVAWKALRHIYNYGNFRTIDAMPKKATTQAEQETKTADQPHQTTVDEQPNRKVARLSETVGQSDNKESPDQLTLDGQSNGKVAESSQEAGQSSDKPVNKNSSGQPTLDGEMNGKSAESSKEAGQSDKQDNKNSSGQPTLDGQSNGKVAESSQEAGQSDKPVNKESPDEPTLDGQSNGKVAESSKETGQPSGQSVQHDVDGKSSSDPLAGETTKKSRRRSLSELLQPVKELGRNMFSKKPPNQPSIAEQKPGPSDKAN